MSYRSPGMALLERAIVLVGLALLAWALIRNHEAQAASQLAEPPLQVRECEPLAGLAGEFAQARDEKRMDRAAYRAWVTERTLHVLPPSRYAMVMEVLDRVWLGKASPGESSEEAWVLCLRRARADARGAS